MPPTLNALLKSLVEQGGDELHISFNSPPQVLINGQLRALNTPPLTPSDTQSILLSVMADEQELELRKQGSIRFSFAIKGLARFEAFFYFQRGAMSGVFIARPHAIRTLRDLNLAGSIPFVEELVEMQGLGLVTGPANSGKGETLAAIVDNLNKRFSVKILVLGMRTPFLHSHQNALVESLEIGSDISSLDDVVQTVLSARAQVVAFNEVESQEEILQVLHLAQLGLNVLATTAGATAAEALRGWILKFPPHHQYSVRSQLSMGLKWLIAQQKIAKRNGKGRALALEVIYPGKELAQLLLTNQLEAIERLPYESRFRTPVGNEIRGRPMNQSLALLYLGRIISLQAALAHSSNPRELQEIIDREGKMEK